MRRFTFAIALLLLLALSSGSVAAQTTDAAPPLPFQTQVFRDSSRRLRAPVRTAPSSERPFSI